VVLFWPGITIDIDSEMPSLYRWTFNGSDRPVLVFISGLTKAGPGTVGQTVLIRMINMGLKNHMPMFQGVHLNVIAEDGNPYNYGKQQYAIHLAAGQTKDALLTLTTVGYVPFFDRRLFLTNKQTTSGIGVLSVAASTAAKQPAGTLISYLAVVPAAVDTDGDGVTDDVDNCTNIANADQRDTDNDGFGNRCDADLDQSGFVNTIDLANFKSVYGTNNLNADLNGDGTVNTIDLAIFRSLYGKVPGPSGLVP